METGKRDGAEPHRDYVSASARQTEVQINTESVTRRLPERSIREFERQALSFKFYAKKDDEYNTQIFSIDNMQVIDRCKLVIQVPLIAKEII